MSDEQKLLVDSVQQFAKKSSPVERFRKLRAEPPRVGEGNVGHDGRAGLARPAPPRGRRRVRWQPGGHDAAGAAPRRLAGPGALRPLGRPRRPDPRRAGHPRAARGAAGPDGRGQDLTRPRLCRAGQPLRGGPHRHEGREERRRLRPDRREGVGAQRPRRRSSGGLGAHR